jgi:hypothetical protein
MCFNGPKTYQLGWFSQYHLDLTSSSSSISDEIKIYGFADRAQATAGVDGMIIRIMDRSSNIDYYVNFNHAYDFNSGTQEGRNQVLITSRSYGTGYGESDLLAKLNSGGTHTLSNFGGSGLPLAINVTSISTVSGYAQVQVSWGIQDPQDLNPTCANGGVSCPPTGGPSSFTFCDAVTDLCREPLCTDSGISCPRSGMDYSNQTRCDTNSGECAEPLTCENGGIVCNYPEICDPTANSCRLPLCTDQNVTCPRPDIDANNATECQANGSCATPTPTCKNGLIVCNYPEICDRNTNSCRLPLCTDQNVTCPRPDIDANNTTECQADGSCATPIPTCENGLIVCSYPEICDQSTNSCRLPLCTDQNVTCPRPDIDANNTTECQADGSCATPIPTCENGLIVCNYPEICDRSTDLCRLPLCTDEDVSCPRPGIDDDSATECKANGSCAVPPICNFDGVCQACVHGTVEIMSRGRRKYAAAEGLVVKDAPTMSARATGTSVKRKSPQRAKTARSFARREKFVTPQPTVAERPFALKPM